ncbi:TadE family protein [Catenulispora pinisilvae]|uniref:TadE family protein n=1 Tax=Catenulispora pinisilvae TaxID=2705253 RepID=UPI001891DF82|nr:TadE family protein [Catenulispora pinisilvae]
MTAVEFAFLTPMVFIVLMATVQFAVYLFAKQAAQSAARAGDRVARAEAATMGCFSANAPWQGDAQAAVAARATGISGKLLTFTTADITTTATPDNTVQAACPASVTVSFDAGVPQFLPWMPKRVHVTATGPVEQFVRHP